MQQSTIQTACARDLRFYASPADRILWNMLRDRRFMGLKFRRYAPIGPLIVGFLCIERRLVVECHQGPPTTDLAWLTARGFSYVHLCHHQVLTDSAGCLRQLAANPCVNTLNLADTGTTLADQSATGYPHTAPSLASPHFISCGFSGRD